MFPKWLRQNRAQRWIWLGAAALVAVQLYYVREMLAALLLFSMGFAVVGSVILLLFLLDRGLYRTLEWAQPHTARATHWVRHSWSLAGEFGKKQLQRFEQPAEH
jgi:hypothetical protein